MKQLFTAEEIEMMVSNIAVKLNYDYARSPVAINMKPKSPILIGVLNGGFVFLADLARKLDFDFQIDFCQVHSYTDNKRHEIEFLKKWESNLFEKDVIIVDDIVDSAKTVEFLKNKLERCGPASVKVCALIVRKNQLAADYYGFTINDEFVFGYGLDDLQFKRGLKNIYQI